jgi:hypothetical protein
MYNFETNIVAALIEHVFKKILYSKGYCIKSLVHFFRFHGGGLHAQMEHGLWCDWCQRLWAKCVLLIRLLIKLA